MAFIRQMIRSYKIIGRKARLEYLFTLISLSILTTLDLMGITFFLLLISNYNSISSDNFVSNFPVLNGSLSTLKIFLQNHLTIMLIITILLFVSKSFLGLLINFINTRILSNETKKVTERLIKIIFESNISGKSKYNSHDYSYVLGEGVRLALLDTLFSASILFSDFFLIIVITVNLFFVAKVIFIPTILFFAAIFFILNRVIKKLTRNSFTIAHETDQSSKLLTQETILSRREFKAAGVSDYYLRRIAENRNIAINAHSKITFSNMLPKYVYEVGLFLGIALIALSTKISGESTNIILNVTLFVLSSSRIVPALLRVQFYLTILAKASAQSLIVFEILKNEIEPGNRVEIDLSSTSDKKSANFVPTINVEKVSFAYPNNPDKNIITDITLKIGKGEFLSLVGRSGSGKSTLLDLILGTLEPDSGSILVSGVNPLVASKFWPKKISYVPQKVTILRGDIYENIALGQRRDLIDKGLVHEVLKNVHLFDYFNSTSDGFSKNLGEFGSHLSGGQLQRIGIARALYSDSELMVFDESMSALDAQSEAAILEILWKFKGSKTIVMVTHRLSALQNTDTVIYMDNGNIIFSGDFQSVQDQVPDFAEQVRLQSIEIWENENKSN